MELLLIPVLLISGTVLVYLGAGGSNPFSQPTPPTLGLDRRPEFIERISVPSSAATARAVSESPSSGSDSLELTARGSTESGFIPEPFRGDMALVEERPSVEEIPPYQPEPYQPGPDYHLPSRPTPDAHSREQELLEVAASAPAYLAVEPSSTDLLLTDLLGELLEMRKELAAVRLLVDSLVEPPTRRPATALGARTPLFAARRGAAVETT